MVSSWCPKALIIQLCMHHKFEREIAMHVEQQRETDLPQIVGIASEDRALKVDKK